RAPGFARRREAQRRRLQQGSCPRCDPWCSSRSSLARLRRRAPLAFELLAGLFGALGELALQLVLPLLEHLGIGGRSGIGLGEIAKRHHQAERLAGAVEALHYEALSLLQFVDQFAARLVIGHAAIVETDYVRGIHWLALVDDC